MIVAGTGHRDLRDRDWIAAQTEKALIDMGASLVYVGMASGFDLLLAKTAWGLGIPFIAAKPWRGHQPRRADHYDYHRALELAEEVVNVLPNDDYPGAWAYQKRNEYMVDNAEAVLGMLEAGRTGGTYNCIKYASGKMPIKIIDPLMREVWDIEKEEADPLQE
ncbi:GTP-binding domain [Streptomyces phage Jay2Jay]|uniref:DprA-like DNA processing chain A n=2 Tax=Samistivirus jay2jay TaxID=2560786 RepID=A0A221SB07_9CAUD|nr:GTP-binding domain [Streptomyces phage Jay2Jay]AIW02593.1 DprA-like ssDNA binding protein [Streptomyces phage Jay2Jay]ASN73168.1 DprA-like ssDNA binding protein [Streptomyces phage Warpy]